MEITPVTLTEAREFVNEHHRHHKAPQGGILAIGLAHNDIIIGVLILGRPVARMLQDGFTAEVTRVAVIPGNPNACSMLYGAARRVAFGLGYRRLITYTLQNEPGASLRAAGWKLVGHTKGGQWSRQSRPRLKTAHQDPKIRWETTP